ncbi:MAG TPA: D-2-hydroxyacid dehydrogenase [Pyrinomonadaceae bacterium]|jgi:glycerate dehydrogenase|nr:D-2-hydroxyacid dehydrogenase [Pyrinomonadaceae bacterium]
METIVFLERDTLRAELRRPAFEHRWTDYGVTRPEEVLERLRDATVAVVNKLPLRAEVLARLPALKLVAVAATGTDNIDLEFCRERDIAVSNVRGYAQNTLPEHVLTLALALRRNLFAYRDAMRAGAWQRAEQFCVHAAAIHDLHGSTLGLFGHGTLGRGVERLARAFGMRVLVAERRDAPSAREGRTPFEEVLRRSDVVSLHVPLNAGTRGMIGREELALMKPSAILINCARGGVVDEGALADALREGRIAGAGVDVLSREPPTGDNPLLAPDFPNLIVTPHVAWASREAQQALADRLVENIEAFFEAKAVKSDK